MAQSLRKKKNKKDGQQLDGDVKRSILSIILFLLALISLLGFFESAAVIGEWFNDLFGIMFGVGKWIAPLILVLIGIVLLKKKERTFFYITNSLGFFLAFASILGLLHIFVDADVMKALAQDGRGGGYLGYLSAITLKTYTGMIAGVAVLTSLLVISVLVSFNLSILPVLKRLRDRAIDARDHVVAKTQRHEEEDYDYEDEDEDEDDDENDEDNKEELEANIKSMTFAGDQKKKKVEQSENENSKRKEEDVDEVVKQKNKVIGKSIWRVPPITLMEGSTDKAHAGDTSTHQNIIKETFQNFGITLVSDGIIVGPTVTQFAFRPQAGVKLSRITALSNDLALALAAHPIRIEAPIPGKSLIGIEVPNKVTASVRMRDSLRAKNFPYRSPGLKMALGKDVSGGDVIADLASMPHILVAGATGAGKSVTVNAMIVSLLYQNTPEDLRFILVDPKRVELSLYNGIPHLLSEVIVENGKVLNALKWAVGEMERRYALLQSASVRELASYNKKVEDGELDPQEHEKLPAIVIVIDEMADLMSSHGKEVEGVIVRLAQMARAIGIHLILSTQRPSVEVLTGLIKANVPTRIALRVATQIDSRTILDMPGAEKLIGRGDMLYLSPSEPQPKRIQSIYVTDEEVKKVVNFLKKQEWSDESDDVMTESMESSQTKGSAHAMDFAQTDNDDRDQLYDEAKAMIIQSQRASTSYLQRRFRIGYSRAARLMDSLEEDGVISAADGAKSRDVLVNAEEQLGHIDKSAVPIVEDKG